MIYAELGAMGCPVQVGTAPELPEGKVEIPAATIADAWGLMLVSGEWMPRPVLAAPVMSGLTVMLPDAPEGTTIEATQGSSITTVTGAAITVPAAGGYWIEVTPPLPTMPMRFRAELA